MAKILIALALMAMLAVTQANPKPNLGQATGLVNEVGQAILGLGAGAGAAAGATAGAGAAAGAGAEGHLKFGAAVTGAAGAEGAATGHGAGQGFGLLGR